MDGDRDFFEPEHEDFRSAVRQFVEREVAGRLEEWDERRVIDRATWLSAGKHGLLGFAVPEEFGGGGTADYRFRCVLAEELAAVGAASLNSGFALQDDIFIPYLLRLGTEAQQRRWLPGLCAGELIGAIAMTEPSAGSDLQGITSTARPDGDDWILNGAKTFITNGIQSDLVIVVARTGTAGEAGPPPFGLFIVERDAPGFERGRKLRKIGLHAQDTAELFFTDVRVPAENVLGDPGRGFVHLMENLPLERLSIAVTSLGAAASALAWTADHVRERHAFGKPLAAQQSIQFTIAEIATEVDVTRSYVRDAVRAHNAGTLTPVDAAKAKWWATEVHKRTVDRCLQLFGGYGYMAEYPIARAFVDARVQTIYGGATEIMKLLIARDVLGKFSLFFACLGWNSLTMMGAEWHRPAASPLLRAGGGPPTTRTSPPSWRPRATCSTRSASTARPCATSPAGSGSPSPPSTTITPTRRPSSRRCSTAPSATSSTAASRP
jgi:alkylation response protein AidB-like acyl-CoA dehydrogenase